MSNQDNDFKKQISPQSFSEDEEIFSWQIMKNQNINSDSLKQISPLALAYIGDAIYELYIRTHYLFPLKRIGDYHKQVVEQVRAETQAHYLQSLQPHLNELEKEIVRRARNATTKVPRHLPRTIYQQATGLEALIGYLYLTNPSRLEYLLKLIEIN